MVTNDYIDIETGHIKRLGKQKVSDRDEGNVGLQPRFY